MPGSGQSRRARISIVTQMYGRETVVGARGGSATHGLTIRGNARGRPHHKAGDAPFRQALAKGLRFACRIDLGFRIAEQISSAPPNSLPSLICIS